MAQELIMNCPICGSNKIAMEKRPDGDSKCLECGYKDKSLTFGMKAYCSECKDQIGQDNPIWRNTEFPDQSFCMKCATGKMKVQSPEGIDINLRDDHKELSITTSIDGDKADEKVFTSNKCSKQDILNYLIKIVGLSHIELPEKAKERICSNCILSGEYTDEFWRRYIRVNTVGLIDEYTKENAVLCYHRRREVLPMFKDRVGCEGYKV